MRVREMIPSFSIMLTNPHFPHALSDEGLCLKSLSISFTEPNTCNHRSRALLQNLKATPMVEKLPAL